MIFNPLRKFRWFLLTLLMGTLASAQYPTPTPKTEASGSSASTSVTQEKKDIRYAAKVNGVGIPQRDLDELVAFSKSNRAEPPTEDEAFDIKLNLLNGLIFAEVQKQKAAEADIPVSATEIQLALDSIRANFNFNDKDFLSSLASKGLTEDEFRKTLEEEIRVRKYQESIMDQFEIKFSDEDLSDWYERNKEEFKSPAIARISHILFALPEDATAEMVSQVRQQALKVLDQIVNAGEPFEEMARLYSADEISAASGGLLGDFTQDNLIPAFQNVVFKMQPSQITEPIRSSAGLHLVRLDRLLPSRQMTFEEVKESGLIQMDYIRNQKALYFRDWLVKEREKAQVEFLDPEIIPKDARAR